ncbi:TOMM precursor leader peptide-binding protein [Micromonospora sp. WMMD882]|uniref:TOMM precursor leader peptide-binding protein n=1 Tax=Micromonospora sp. WMMD882 TaxID=3015151 RepID=UPI00248ABE67|nr:TOMM precursor leader peptide-binding protein [Micromonospora sp. WMMD882]WBB77315.1 TOMM precursor leader peptide-binding protein [Micromonospora sp. WMMD882]
MSTVAEHPSRGRATDLRSSIALLAGDLVRLVGPDAAPQPGADIRLAVLVDLSWDADLRALPRQQAPLLPVYGCRGRLVVGPLVEPDRPNCPHCLALRVRVTNQPEGAVTDAETAWRPLSGRPDEPAWPVAAGYVVAALLRAEAQRLAAGEPPRSRDAAFVLDDGGLAGDWHPAIAHTLCRAPHCTATATPVPPPLPDLDAALPATGPASTRRFPVTEFADRLESEYVDSWSGVTRTPILAGDAALPSVQVKVPTRWGFEEIAIGRADDYVTARAGAVLEGLERYAGWHCGGRDPVRFAAFADLADGVDPRSLLLHEDDAYDQPGFEYTRFDPHTPTGWALAHSVLTGRAVHLPFHVAYYGATQRPGTGPAFVYENSNGCALGAGVEEALLAALLEVAERDAFLTAWYSRTPLPEIDLDRVTGADAAALRGLRHRTGRELRAFQVVGPFGVPVVLLVSLADDPAVPATLVTAGCALTVSRALRGAVQEMAAAAPAITMMYRQQRPSGQALARPALVRHMTDHALVAGLPEARGRFDFLLAPAGRPAPVPATHVPRGDVAADLAAMLDVARADGQEVFVVDHTTSELHRLGLRCVKAVVPGTTPMTFGHSHRRMPTSAAIARFRLRNGVGPTVTAGEEVRHEPHPFP